MYNKVRYTIPANQEIVSTNLSALKAKNQLQHYISAGTADNTRKTYQAAVRHFIKWGGQLPCQQNDIVQYLLFFAEKQNTRTLKVRLSALSQWHLLQGFSDPTASLEIKKIMKGITRTHACPEQKASACYAEHFNLMMLFLSQKKTLSDYRNQVLISLGFLGAFRRSELVSLKVSNLQFEKQGVLICLNRSKTDQAGKGITKAIPVMNHPLCPVKLLTTWLACLNSSEHYLFPFIDRWGNITNKPLTPAGVNLIIKKVAKEAGLPEGHWSSHSLRRGLATSAYRAGASFESIKRQGGWISDATVWGYIEKGKIFDNNPAAAIFTKI